MLFRSFIYLDSEKFNDCVAVLDRTGKDGLRKASRDYRIKGSFNAGLMSIEAEYGKQANLEKGIDDNLSAAYDLFEAELSKHTGDGYYDLLAHDVDLLTVMPMSLLRFNGMLDVPEAFDMYSVVSQFLPFMKRHGMLDVDKDDVSSEFALSLFDGANVDVPILIETDDVIVSSKLKTSLINGGYEALEEYMEEELTFLCRVASHSCKENVVVFDPLKDFVKIGRAARRQIVRNDSAQPIVVPGPVLKVDVVAIYH